MTTALRTPVAVDTDLAAAHRDLDEALTRMDRLDTTVQDMYSDRTRYAGRRPVWKHTLEEVWAMVEAAAANGDERKSYYDKAPSELLRDREARLAAVKAVQDRIRALNSEYRGWSRFFLVTSSAGHVHARTSCQTCRITTTFGWMPHLSGLSEAEAVAQLGAVLCSVCFPSAPVEHVGGKVTKARAAMMAAKALEGR